MHLTGIHHLTAVTADVSRNFAFYVKLLGLRLVKKTVNQDDTSAYHLFYGDGVASPGSDITFFDWPLQREKQGTNSIVRSGFRVAGDSFSYWKRRFDDADVCCGDIASRDGRTVLDFEDFEGQRLSLIEDDMRTPAHPWPSSSVPHEHQIRGLGPVSLSVADLEPTDRVLIDVLGMAKVRTYDAGGTTHVYAMGAGGPSAELHVTEDRDAGVAIAGAGGVHHVAFRIPDAEYDAWAERFRQIRLPKNGPVDRFYFRSMYFREPNGILFEIATDGPGFATDEPLDRLGERLALPPFLEGKRRAIEAGLKPL